MEDALRDLPETLEGLYEDLLKRIPKDYKEKARLILMWLTYSLQPLTLEELASAVAISNPLKVLEVCNSSLVSLQRDGDRSLKLDDAYPNIRVSIVKLDHFSVKEYLLSERLLASVETGYFHVNPPVAHLTIAETSVSHIINTNDVVLANVSELDPLLWYSTSWFKHTKEADAFGTSMPGSTELTSKARSAEAQLDLEVLKTKCHRLLDSRFAQSYRNWYHLLQVSYDISLREEKRLIRSSPGNNDSREHSPIFIASLLGMIDNVRRFLDDGVNVDGDLESRAWIRKPVLAAAIAGNLKGLIMLLDRGASFNQSDLDVVACHDIRHGADVLITILQSRQDLAVTDHTLKELAGNTCSSEMLEYILDVQDIVTLTESMLVAMIKITWETHWNDDKKIGTRLMGIGYEKDQMVEVFLRGDPGGLTVEDIETVIYHYNINPSKIQDVMLWLMDNRTIGSEKLQVIVKCYNNIEIRFSQDILVKAADSGQYGAGLFWFMVRHSKNILITEPVMSCLAINRDYGHVVFSLLMDHSNCKVNDLEDLEDLQIVHAVETHMRTCPIRISRKRMRAAARWEPAAIKYLQDHARPNVTFAKTLADAEPSNSNT